MRTALSYTYSNIFSTEGVDLPVVNADVSSPDKIVIFFFFKAFMVLFLKLTPEL